MNLLELSLISIKQLYLTFFFIKWLIESELNLWFIFHIQIYF
jgi:hypothetical protein